MPTTQLFYDSEFTGLRQHTTLISIGLVCADGRGFYAEFIDYDRAQCDDWLRDNVLTHTHWLAYDETGYKLEHHGAITYCLGDTDYIAAQLKNWLAQFDALEIWGDCLAYDWVLFCELFGGALRLPKNIFYMPQDLATLFKLKGLCPDTDRVAFSGLPPDAGHKHNALWDAQVAQACHAKLMARP